MSNNRFCKKAFPSETNLPAIKALARSLLMLDIQSTKFSPIIVKHPFTDSGIVGLGDENGSPDAVNLLDDGGRFRRTSGPAWCWVCLHHNSKYQGFPRSALQISS